MKHLTLYENMGVYSNEAFRLPYPNVSFVNELFKKKLFYREEPAWVKCVYEIPSEAFESTSAVTVLNSVPGYINDYKINGVYGEVEPLRVEEGVEVDVFQPYTMEGTQMYLPTTDACFLVSDLTTETEFILSRPLNETDIIIEIIYNGNELVDVYNVGTVADFGEDIHYMFSFRSDTIYTYSDNFLEGIKEQGSMFEGMKLGIFFVNSEWYGYPLEAPSLNTTMIGYGLVGGVQKVEVLPSMLDENNKVVIEYSLLEHYNTINNTFRNIDYLKEIDFTRLNFKNNSKRRFQIASEAFIDCSVLENVKIGDYIISIGDNAFDGCISLPVYDNAYYADTYCVGVINNDVTSCIIKEGTKWINPNGFPGLNSKLESVVIPGSVISIPEYVFSNHDKLKTVEIGNGVTSIGERAFYQCSGLTGELIIPDSVTSIGERAFYECWGLTSLEIGSGVTSIGDSAFDGCSRLTGELIIPDSVISIGDSAFTSCRGLTSLEIGSGCTSIGNMAFYQCWGLISLEIGSGVTSIGDSAFTECKGLTSVVIPDSVTSIGNGAFHYCSGLTGELVIPNSVTSIGVDAFSDCPKLEAIVVSSGNAVYDSRENCNCIIETATNTLVVGCKNSFIPDSVTSIGERAFHECSGLTSVVIPDSVTRIGDYAFSDCDGLTSVDIPDSVTSIGDYAFESCTGLISVVIPDSVTSIGSKAFWACSKLTSVVIPDSVTSIGSEAFRSCWRLTSVEIGSGVTYIADSAFYACSKLTSVVIPDSVTSIGDSAFYACDALTNITIPDSVTSIGNYAFQFCYGLAEIICHAVTAPSIDSETFRNVSTFGKLIYPDGSDYSSWLSTDSYYLGYYGWFVKEIGTVPELTLDGYDVVMLVQPVTTGSTKICNKTTSIAEIKVNDTVLDTVSTGYTFSEVGKWNVVRIKYTDGVTSVPSSGFSGCTRMYELKIADSVTSIGNYAFESCSGLTSLEIGSGCTSIGDYAFKSCSRLTGELVIPDSVTSIGERAFDGCSGLTSVEIGSGVTTIGINAFTNCSGLESIVIGSGVTSIGKYAFYRCSGLTSVVIPDSVTSIGDSAFYECSGLTSVEIGSGRTSIGQYAFYYCSRLTSLEIGSRVTSIGTRAFDGCTSLSGELIIPDSVTRIGDEAFRNCSGLESIVIGSGVTRIGSFAFSYCSGLTSVVIPDSVTIIGDRAFYNCPKLEAIVVSSGNAVYDSRENCNCIIKTSTNTLIQGCKTSFIPNSVTSIGDSAFNQCSGLTGELVIPDSVTSIGGYAFYNCSGLTSVEIGSGCTSIGGNAFQYCYGLTGELIIPDSVTSIGGNAFQTCSGLTSVEIGSGCTSIGGDAFHNCLKLETIIVSSENTKYDSRENCNCIIETATNTLVVGCKNSFIPDSVTSIGSSAFSGCSGLTGELVIPDSVKSIGQHAFNQCKGLTSLEIGSGVTSIGYSAFYQCSGLTGELAIPDSVKSIGTQAFQGCSGLTSLEIGSGVTSIGNSAFQDCSGLTSLEIGSGVTSIENYAFSGCSQINSITCHAVTAPSISNNTFNNVKTYGILYIPFGSDYSSWMSTNSYYLGYYNWTQQVMYSPIECTSLSITADDVNGRATNTIIYWTAVTNGTDSNGTPMNNITLTGETVSSEFPQNTSETETVERTITFEYMGVTASTTITQGVWISQGYTVDLNSQWQLSTSIANPDSSVYEGVYESFSNKGVNNSADIMYIDIVGYENFNFYVRSNGESGYDYVVVSNLDCPLTSGTTGGTDVKMTTRSNPQSGTAISNYTLVEFTGIDGGEHRISVMYRKDSGTSSGTDQGYVLIPKNQ